MSAYYYNSYNLLFGLAFLGNADRGPKSSSAAAAVVTGPRALVVVAGGELCSLRVVIIITI